MNTCTNELNSHCIYVSARDYSVCLSIEPFAFVFRTYMLACFLCLDGLISRAKDKCN